ncbi:MAG: FadR/GntR family transcriptional regulator [Rhizobiaceae bacterium]
MLSDTLSDVRAWLASEKTKVGERLPPERTLAERLGISRAELRKALMILESEGHVERRMGCGTFLTLPASQPNKGETYQDIAALAERTGPHEAMMARLSLEPELALLAALHATPRQIAELRRLSQAMRDAQTWLAYEKLDSAFHDLIAQSSGNALLHEVHRIINDVRRIVVWRRLSPQDAKPAGDYHSFDEHDAIVDALEDRDKTRAQSLMRRHLRSTLEAMTQHD